MNNKYGVLFLLIILISSVCYSDAKSEVGTVPMNGYGEDWTCTYDPQSEKYYFCINSDARFDNFLSGNTTVYEWNGEDSLKKLFSVHGIIREIIAYDETIYYRQDTLSMSTMKIGCWDNRTRQHQVVFKGACGSLCLVNHQSLWYTSDNALFQYSITQKTHTRLFSADRFYTCAQGIAYSLSGKLMFYDPVSEFQSIIDDNWEANEYVKLVNPNIYYYATSIHDNFIVINGKRFEVSTFDCVMSDRYVVWVDTAAEKEVMYAVHIDDIGFEEPHTFEIPMIRRRPILINSCVFFLTKERDLPVLCMNLTTGKIVELNFHSKWNTSTELP